MTVTIKLFLRRSAIDSSLANNMHDVLLHNDQLRSNMQRSLVLQHFSGA
jgi:hypothetical protein